VSLDTGWVEGASTSSPKVRGGCQKNMYTVVFCVCSCLLLGRIAMHSIRCSLFLLLCWSQVWTATKELNRRLRCRFGYGSWSCIRLDPGRGRHFPSILQFVQGDKVFVIWLLPLLWLYTFNSCLYCGIKLSKSTQSFKCCYFFILQTTPPQWWSAIL